MLQFLHIRQKGGNPSTEPNCFTPGNVRVRRHFPRLLRPSPEPPRPLQAFCGPKEVNIHINFSINFTSLNITVRSLITINRSHADGGWDGDGGGDGGGYCSGEQKYLKVVFCKVLRW